MKTSPAAIKPDVPPELAAKVEAVLDRIQRRHGQFRQINLERDGEGWRLRYRRMDPATGRLTRFAVSLRGTPDETAVMAEYLRRRIESATAIHAAGCSARTAAEAARWRCQSRLRKLRARVLAACPHGRRQRDDLGLAFDLAAGWGLKRLEEFLGLKLWEQSTRRHHLDGLDAAYQRMYPSGKDAAP